jgi:hypothetical protein
MKIWSIVIGMLITLCSCSTRPLPTMPKVNSQQARDCLRHCQREHRLCSSACQGMVLRESRCLSQCNQKLEECYRLCVEEESNP